MNREIAGQKRGMDGNKGGFKATPYSKIWKINIYLHKKLIMMMVFLQCLESNSKIDTD